MFLLCRNSAVGVGLIGKLIVHSMWLARRSFLASISQLKYCSGFEMGTTELWMVFDVVIVVFESEDLNCIDGEGKE